MQLYRPSQKGFTSAIRICVALLAALLLAGCGTPVPGTATPVPQTFDSLPQTFDSLEKVDDHPLYVMHYYEDYSTPAAVVRGEAAPGWTCSLFAALGDPQSTVYGRNFDWEPTPALLLFTYPADGYASMSMVNLIFLGFSHEQATDLLALSEAERKPLVRAPFLPIDGMNEWGLVVGLAAVPQSQDRTDLDRPSIGSLGIIREMLDHARSVDEAIAIMKQYTIRFDGGPPIHYLIAEATGRAVLVEYGSGELHAIPNDGDWHVATNFLVESV
jgi:penicillin V acylase-like amidase (Ntn superfamily)